MQVRREPLDIEDTPLGYSLEAYSFIPETPAALIVTAFGVPRGTENDKSYVPDRFAPYIAEAGFVTTTHSPEGLGKSGGDTSELTLEKRAKEIAAVAAAAREAYPALPLVLYGSSMGAHLIIRAADMLKGGPAAVDDLVLVSSAAYPDRSERARFGEEFRVAITGAHELERDDFSVFQSLESYLGRIALVWAEGDSTERGGPINPEMMAWYEEVLKARLAAGKDDIRIEVPGVEHSFRREGRNIQDDPQAEAVFKGFCEEIGKFVTRR